MDCWNESTDIFRNRLRVMLTDVKDGRREYNHFVYDKNPSDFVPTLLNFALRSISLPVPSNGLGVDHTCLLCTSQNPLGQWWAGG